MKKFLLYCCTLLCLLPATSQEIVIEDIAVAKAEPPKPSITTNAGWLGAVSQLSLSPSQRILAALGEKSIHFFDLQHNRQFLVLPDLYNVRNILMLNEEELLYSLIDRVILFNTTTRSWSEPFAVPSAIHSWHLDAAKHTLYLCMDKGVLRMEFPDGYSKQPALQKELKTDHPVKAIATGKTKLYLGLENGDIAVYDKDHLQLQTVLKGHNTTISSLAVSESESVLVSAARRDYNKAFFGEGIIWDIPNNKIIHRTGETHKQALSAAISKDGKSAFISSLHDIVKYDAAAPKAEYIYSAWLEPDPIFVPYGEDKLITAVSASSYTSPYLRVVNWKTQNIEQYITFDSRQIWSIGFSADKEKLLLDKDDEVMIVGMDNRVLLSKSMRAVDPPSSFISGMVAGPEVIHDRRSEVHFIYDFGTSKSITVPRTNERRDILSVNKTAASIQVLFPHQIYDVLKDASTQIVPLSDSTLQQLNGGEPVAEPRYHSKKFIPATDFFYHQYYTSKLVVVRSTSDHKVKRVFRNHMPVYSNLQKTLILLSYKDSTLLKYDVATNKLTPILNLKKEMVRYDVPYSVSFSADGKSVAVKYGAFGDDILVYSLATKKTYPALKFTDKHIDCFTFSPNNKYLVTGNRYGEVEFWDYISGKKIGTLFTSFLTGDFALYTDQYYDGTEKGIQYLLNFSNNPWLKAPVRKEHLLRMLTKE